MRWADGLALVGLLIVLVAALTQLAGWYDPSVDVTVLPAGIRGVGGT